MYVQGLACCGVRELASIQDHRTPERMVRDFLEKISPHTPYLGAEMRRRDKFRFVIFTDINKRTYGSRLAAYIVEHKLGDVIETGQHKNPNSRNMVRVWVWTLDHRALKLWKEIDNAENL